MKWGLICLILVSVVACKGSDSIFPLFGVVGNNTGLTSEQCQPSCDCEELQFTPPEYSQQFIDSLAEWTLLNPPAALTEDPYDNPNAYPENSAQFCGMLIESAAAKSYNLVTYDSIEQAEQAGAVITHYGACGRCSSLKNLAVYLSYTDMTSPVRECGMLGVGGGKDAVMQCLMAMGFEEVCAEIWYFNSNNTTNACFAVCLAALEDPYHLSTGELNACIVCDETNSGAIFKAVAGRTRRNSGLASVLCRPCSSISPVIHQYE